MKQSSLHVDGLHVGIIMDGNGRWAAGRGLPRSAGHRAGAAAVRRAVEASPGLGIGALTLFAFSSDNWRRPPAEVEALMRLLRLFLRRECAALCEQGVRLEVLGRRDRLSPGVRCAVADAEAATAGGRRLRLRLAIDYSGRDAILAAAQRLGPVGSFDRSSFARALAGESGGSAPDVDLLIRTGGEQRLSDFLLWECAYAEFLFVEPLWPDFSAADLAAAVDKFHRRDRRFGRAPISALAPASA